MSAHLTERQKEVLSFIRQFITKEGVSPTVREVAQHFGFASHLSAQLHINALLKKGLITKTPLKARNIRLTGQEKTSGRSLPLLGKVRAGKPILVAEETKSHIIVNSHMFKHEE